MPTFEQERVGVAYDLRELSVEGGSLTLEAEDLDALADLLEFHTAHTALKLARLLAEG